MISWFAKNDVAANLLMITILGLGVWSIATQLTLEVFPQADIDTVTISVPYRGNNPEEVEEGVVIKIEEAIQDVESIEEITSTATESSGSVSAEIKSGFDPREALDDIKSRVDAIVTFPEEAERPTIFLQQRTDSVVKVVISGDLDEFQLRELGNQVQDEILKLDATAKVSFPKWLPIDRLPIIGGIINGLTRTESISNASMIGVRPYEIAIEVSEKTLLRYNLTIDEVAAAVAAQSVDLSGGTIKTKGGEILLRTKTRAYYGEDFEDIVVRANPDGTVVRIRDLGLVNDGFEEAEVTARFNGSPAVLIDVNRVGDQNAILISDAVTNYVKEKAATLPEGVAITAWRDRSNIVEGRLNTLIDGAVWAFALVFLVLAMFLRIALGGWVILGIPVAFAGAFILMPVLGATINIASLFGFILVLGIVVDDAIVTGENIYTKLRNSTDATKAAIDGANEVARPVIFGILTTMIAFVPLLLIPGFRGAIFRQIPYVVIPVLLFSLIESKLILPAHLKHLKPGRTTPAKWNFIARGQQSVANGLERFVEKVYQPFLGFAIKNRWVTSSVFFFILLATLGWWKSGRVTWSPFPRVASEYVTVSLTMPPGTPYNVTAKYIQQIEDVAYQLKDKYVNDKGESVILSVFSATGGQGISSGRGGRVSSGQTNVGEVSFELINAEDLEKLGFAAISSPALSMELRRMVGQIPGSEDFNVRAEIGRYGDPIDVQLLSSNIEELSLAAEAVEAKLNLYPGLFDIASNVDDGKEEMRIQVKPQAQLLGVDSDDLARQTRGAFFGFEAQRIQRGRDDIRVMVRYPRDERESLRNLDDMRIRTADDARVPFANLAEVEFGRSPSAIRRIDRQRSVNVIADANKQEVDVEAIKASLKEELPQVLAPFPSVRFSMEGEAAEQREANQALMMGSIFVIFAIYCMLAIPFKSMLQPFIVMSVIPFGLIGAVFGHIFIEKYRLLTGHPIPDMPLSFMSLFGMLALSGVVVNDSLVLVDWINRQRDKGIPLKEAVRTGGAARFRAIILTSLTTFVGLIPLVFFEKSTQAQFLIPMAVSLAFGILFATAITLILVPISYLILEDIKDAFGSAWRWYRRPFRSSNSDEEEMAVAHKANPS